MSSSTDPLGSDTSCALDGTGIHPAYVLHKRGSQPFRTVRRGYKRFVCVHMQLVTSMGETEESRYGVDFDVDCVASC